MAAQIFVLRTMWTDSFGFGDDLTARTLETLKKDMGTCFLPPCIFDRLAPVLEPICNQVRVFINDSGNMADNKEFCISMCGEIYNR